MSATSAVAVTVRITDINFLSSEQKDFSNYNKLKQKEERMSPIHTVWPSTVTGLNTHVDSMSRGSVSSELTEPVNKHL